MPSRLVLFAASSALIFLGAWLYSIRIRNDPEMQAALEDPLLTELRTNNPTLTITPGATHTPFYWIEDPVTKRATLLDRDKAPGARVRFHDCDLAAIKPTRLYPNRTAMTCFEVTTPKRTLEAYYFETNDRLPALMAYLQQEVEPDRRINYSKRDRRVQNEYHVPFSKDFIVSYYLEDGRGFVAYQEARHSIN